MEVISTYFEAEDDTNDDLLEIDMVNQKAKMIEEEIMKLKTELRNILKVSYLNGSKKIRITTVALCRIVKTRKQKKRK